MAILPPDPLFCLKSDMGYVHNMCFPQTERNYTNSLLAAAENGFVYTWNLETLRVCSKQKMGDSIQAIHCNGDDLLTQEKCGLLKLWEMRESVYELKREYTCSGGFCKSLLFDQFLVAAQEKNSLDVISLKTLERSRRFAPDRDNLGNVMCMEKVKIDEDLYILAGYETGDVLLFDFATGKVCSHVQLRECITSLTFDPINGRGICANSSNALQVFTIDKGLSIKLKCEVLVTNEGCNVVKLRADRKIFVAGGWDAQIRIFSWKSLRLLVVLSIHRGAISDVQFTPSAVPTWQSNVMAACGADGMISLWNLYN